VKRPKIESNEGKTPALGTSPGEGAARGPDEPPLKGQRDRALLAVLLYHGLRREEAALLQVSDIQERRGIQPLKVHGKGGKVRYLPLHPVAAGRIHQYLESSEHRLAERKMPLFIPLRGELTGAGITANSIYTVVTAYAKKAGIEVAGLGVHGLRATAATNALEHEADIAKVQSWLGHANISRTRIYNRRQNRPEDSPTFRVKY
jgi:site-specific recombinase XerD